MSIVHRLESLLASLDFSCCCWIVILLSLLIVAILFYWKWQAFRSYCQNWIFPFVRRFFFMLIVCAILLCCLAFAVRKFDSLDVVRRATLYFAPYSSSVTIFLVILSLVLICCIPGGPTALLNLSKRLKKAGPFEFFQSSDPDVPIALLDIDSENPEENKLSKLKRAMLKMKYKNETRGISPKGLDSALKILDELSERKKNIVDSHAGKIGAVLVKRDVKLKDTDLFFDAYLERASDCIAVRILPADSQCVSEVAKNIKDFLERIPTANINTFFVHLVLYKSHSRVGNFEELNHLRWLLFNVSNVRLFFYDVCGNNAVAPSENIP